MNDDIIKIYESSEIEIGILVELLKDNGIECFSRSPYFEAINAGWCNQMRSSDSELYVASCDAENAVKLIKEYKDSECTD